MADVRPDLVRALCALLGVPLCLLLAAAQIASAQSQVDFLIQPSNQFPVGQQVVDVRVDGAPAEKVRPHVHTRRDRPLERDVVLDDVRRLSKTKLFSDVKAYYRPVDDGLVVIFRVTQRPVLRYVRYVGNKKAKEKALNKQTGLSVGQPLDTYSIEEGRRRLEEFYQDKGHSKVRVEIFEGTEPGDKGAVYLIHEGPKQRVKWVSFEGNTIASDARLRTQIESKPPIAWIFKGFVDRKKIDGDVKRLEIYYHGLGFWNVDIGRELRFNEDQNWLTLAFIINEGPRFVVRNVSFIGNRKFATETIAKDLNLPSGHYFNQAKMQQDRATIQDVYGADGYVFAAVEPDVRFLEEPGKLDLVYKIEEGARYRVGRINVVIAGDDPHTKRTAVLNRLSLQPGDIVDIRELRASERRLKASGLFANNPATGDAPKIVFSPPEADEDDFYAERPSRGSFRGQSPDPVGYGAPRRHTSRYSPGADRPLDITIIVPPLEESQTVAAENGQLPPNDGQWQLQPSPNARVDGPAGSGDKARLPNVDGGRPAGSIDEYNKRNERPIIRGQYTPLGGRTTPMLDPSRPYAGTAPQNTFNSTVPPGHVPAFAPNTSAPPVTTGTPAPGNPPYVDPGARPSPAYVGPPPGGGYQHGAPTYSGPVQVNPGVSPGNLPPPGTYNGPPAIVPPGGYTGPPEVTPQGEPLPGGLLFEGEPLPRYLDLDVLAKETQTGRLIFGVGVNSDAGLVGSVIIDEQNFDWRRWPRSWDDILSARAFRGDGQQFRIEAVPGTQVQRYMFNFREPYLFDTPVSFGTSAFFFNRIYQDWNEQRLGGRLTFGYQFSPDLSGSVALRGEQVNISNLPFLAPPDLAAVQGNNELFTARFTLAHDTRDSAFLPTEGHLIRMSYEQAFGQFDYPRGEVEVSQYFLLRQRPDGSGRHVLSLSSEVGFSGNQTPVFERFFAGGFSTLRGFTFRGASPRVFNVAVGGDFQWINSIEYLFPITADDTLRGVFFCDYGTVEESIKLQADTFRVTPGFGLRVSVPALGPAPIALDLGVPIAHAPGDQIRNFSFFVGLFR